MTMVCVVGGKFFGEARMAFPSKSVCPWLGAKSNTVPYQVVSKITGSNFLTDERGIRRR